MKSVVHAYLTACVGVVVNTTSMESDIHELHLALFWRHNGHKFPTWAAAAGRASCLP